MTVTYRSAELADAPALSRFFAASFTETFGHLYVPEDLASFLAGKDVAAWEAEIANPALAIRVGIDGEGELSALAKVGPVSLPVEPAGPAAELRQLYVGKSLHGSGVAAALMEWVFETARERGAAECYLSVYVDNHRARRFYERYGFTYVGPYSFMVGDHADEDHIMRLSLRG